VRTRAKILKFVREQVMLSGQVPTKDPLADGMLDSLALEQVISFLEETFGVEIADEDTVEENFESLDALTALVETKRRART
jgi:acyl carrier protein